MVPEEIRGTFADPTIPLCGRLDLLSKKMMDPQGSELILEAVDILQSSRATAARRGKAQLVMQQQLHAAHQEITFLRNYIWEQCGKEPEFIQPSPYETEERRDASRRTYEGKE